MPDTLEKHSVPGGPAISPLAGKPAPKQMLIDVARLEREYFDRQPDVFKAGHGGGLFSHGRSVLPDQP